MASVRSFLLVIDIEKLLIKTQLFKTMMQALKAFRTGYLLEASYLLLITLL